jgi:hypothetical protein
VVGEVQGPVHCTLELTGPPWTSCMVGDVQGIELVFCVFTGGSGNVNTLQRALPGASKAPLA